MVSVKGGGGEEEVSGGKHDNNWSEGELPLLYSDAQDPSLTLAP